MHTLLHKHLIHRAYRLCFVLFRFEMIFVASAEKFPERGVATEKTKPKNNTTKLLSTLSVSCMKIQRRPRPPLPTPMNTSF